MLTPTETDTLYGFRLADMASNSFKEQHSQLTLREGLAEYFASIPGLITADNAAADVVELFRYHDAAHVVFGCDTTLHGENLVDTWTLFGTTCTLKEYWSYIKLPETKQVFRDAGYFRMAFAFLRDIPLLLKLIYRTRKMTRKWPWWEIDRYMGTPLDEIRQEFNIRVIL
jgi:hypothetical protein